MSQVATDGNFYATMQANYEPAADVWETMELRMMQPPPAPTPFHGDPSR